MTDKELDRNAARRLAIIRHAEELTGNVALSLPLLRDQPNGVLHVAAPVPGRRVSRAARPVETATAPPATHTARASPLPTAAGSPPTASSASRSAWTTRPPATSSSASSARRLGPPSPSTRLSRDRLRTGPRMPKSTTELTPPPRRRPRTHHRRPPVPALATGTDGEADALTPGLKDPGKASPKCIRPSALAQTIRPQQDLPTLRPDHARPLFRRKTWPIAARRFLMHRKIAERSYATDQKAESATDTAAADYPRSDAVRRPCIQPGEHTDDRG